MEYELYLNKNKGNLGLLKTVDFNTIVESNTLFSSLIGSLPPVLQPTKVKAYGPIPSFRCEPEHDLRHGPTSGLMEDAALSCLGSKGLFLTWAGISMDELLSIV